MFSNDTYEKATLYMSEEGVAKSSSLDPWKNFKNIKVHNFNTGIEDVVVDSDAAAPCEVLNLSGVKVGNDLDGLAPGIYIVRREHSTKKIAVE